MKYQIYTYDTTSGWNLNFNGSEIAKFDNLTEAESHADELSKLMECDFGVFDVSDPDGDGHLEYQTNYYYDTAKEIGSRGLTIAYLTNAEHFDRQSVSTALEYFDIDEETSLEDAMKLGGCLESEFYNRTDFDATDWITDDDLVEFVEFCKARR